MSKLRTMGEVLHKMRSFHKKDYSDKNIEETFEEGGMYGLDCARRELHAEAIEWIKEFEKGECECEWCYDNGATWECSFCKKENIAEWIKHFFNIEESDLEEDLD